MKVLKSQTTTAPHPKPEGLSLFREAGLSSRAINQLSELLSVVTFHAGETIVNANDVVSQVSIIASGNVSVYDHRVEFPAHTDSKTRQQMSHVEQAKIAVLTTDDHFGTHTLFTPARIGYTVVANPSSTLLILDGAAFDQFAKEDPTSAFLLQAAFARELTAEIKKAQDRLRLLYTTFQTAS